MKKETKDDLLDLLNDCRDYMHNYADADHNGENFVPNKEMSLLVRIDEIILLVDQLEPDSRKQSRCLDGTGFKSM